MIECVADEVRFNAVLPQPRRAGSTQTELLPDNGGIRVDWAALFSTAIVGSAAAALEVTEMFGSAT